jgi:ATP-dependent exoDNAse (exonuclease V) beta subunit
MNLLTAQPETGSETARPSDQPQRDRFEQAIDENFTVDSPAGSGKTSAITNRIGSIAAAPKATEILPSLAVVTFTKKAAAEMQSRASAMIRGRRLPPPILHAFNRAFFGTIHSFAVMLLRNHGHYLGIPGLFRALDNEDAIWREFLNQHSGRPARMDPASFASLTRVCPFQDVLELARSYEFTRPAPRRIGAIPLPDISKTLAFPLPKRANQAANILAHQQALRTWLKAMSAPGDYCPLPEVATGGAEFLETVAGDLADLRHWIARAFAEAVHDLALDYRAFRIRKGALSFNDQVSLAALLLRNPKAAKEIRSKGYRVILDEAQDTDPHQFRLLLESTRPADAGIGSFLNSLKDGPLPGHFCMVGDPQQSIFSERADLGFYMDVRRALLESKAAEALTFSVTFRCDRAIVDFANATCPPVLNGENGQVPFTTLFARPGASSGQVVRVPIPVPVAENAEGADGLALHATRTLGIWLRDTGLNGLRASRWGQVALICPRKDWFLPLRQGLTEAGLRCHFQSTSQIYGDSPAFAWLTALAVIWSDPTNALEIFGVLREVFGLSDHEIAVFADGHPDRLNLANPPTGISAVEVALRTLASCRDLFAAHSLRDALAQSCDRINLQGRLASLPAEVFPGMGGELETLLLRASAAEAEGLTLPDFASQLRALFAEKLPPAEVSEDAIPVITNLKAKGLQWDAVVLPFFGRSISFPNLPYPRFLPIEAPTPIAFSSGDISESWKLRLSTARFQEIERVLYVSLTRPRRTLVFVDDTDLWAPAGKGVAANSLARALKVDSANLIAWLDLPTACSPYITAAPRAHPLGESLQAMVLPDVVVPPLVFPTRILPHQLAKRVQSRRRIEDPEQPATTAPEQLLPPIDDGPGLQYGVWWHNAMRAIPWSNGPAAADAVFALTRATCPDTARADREWSALKATDVGARLLDGSVAVRTELPFMVTIEGGNAVDGVIDLVAFDPSTRRWLIIDWKTDRESAPASLLGRYREQIISYRASLGEILQMPVDAFIFATGQSSLIAV